MRTNNRDVWQSIRVQGETYKIYSQLYDEEYVLYRKFMVSKDLKLVAVFKLGITKVALKISNYNNEFNAPPWLFEQGLAIAKEMIEKNSFTKDSGIITSYEMSKNKVNWQDLELLSLEEKYSR